MQSIPGTNSSSLSSHVHNPHVSGQLSVTTPIPQANSKVLLGKFWIKKQSTSGAKLPSMSEHPKVGILLVEMEGLLDGSLIGKLLGCKKGRVLGINDGFNEGTKVGNEDGVEEGSLFGINDGFVDGIVEGAWVGNDVGVLDGT